MVSLNCALMIGRRIKPSSCNLVAICWTELILHERLLYISMLTKHMLVSKCWTHMHCHWIVNNAYLCGDWGYRLLGLVHVPIQFQWIWQLSISRMEIKFVPATKSLSQLYYFRLRSSFMKPVLQWVRYQVISDICRVDAKSTTQNGTFWLTSHVKDQI